MCIGEKFLFNRESKPSKLVFRKFYREYPDRNDLAEEISGDMMEKCYHNYPHYEGSKCGYPTWNRSETLCDFEGSDFLLQIDMRDVEGYDWMETTTFYIFYHPRQKDTPLPYEYILGGDTRIIHAKAFGSSLHYRIFRTTGMWAISRGWASKRIF